MENETSHDRFSASLRDAILVGRKEAVRQMLNDYPSLVHHQDKKGHSPLAYAADLEMLEFLVRCGFRPAKKKRLTLATPVSMSLIRLPSPHRGLLNELFELTEMVTVDRPYCGIECGGQIQSGPVDAALLVIERDLAAGHFLIDIPLAEKPEDSPEVFVLKHGDGPDEAHVVIQAQESARKYHYFESQLALESGDLLPWLACNSSFFQKLL